MSRLKRGSSVLETARRRLAGLKSIVPAPELGANLSLTVYEAKINGVSGKLDGYNERLSGLDQYQNEFDASEDELREMNVRILAVVEGLYGPDSNEYEQAGGTRRRDRKRSGSKASKTAPQPTT